MKYVRLSIYLLFFLVFSFAVGKKPVDAQYPDIVNNINVNGLVPGFNLYLSGLFSPDSVVVLYNKDFTTGIGAFKTDSNGYFDFKIPLGYLSPVELCISGIGLDNLDSRPFCFEIDLKKNNYYINGINLSPTIKLVKSSQNTPNIQGYSMPNSSVIIVLNKSVLQNISSDSRGYYDTPLLLSDQNENEIYTYAVGDSFVTKESKYLYISSEGEGNFTSQNYVQINSVYALIYDKFIYLFLLLVFILIILLCVFNRDKLRALFRQ